MSMYLRVSVSLFSEFGFGSHDVLREVIRLSNYQGPETTLYEFLFHQCRGRRSVVQRPAKIKKL